MAQITGKLELVLATDAREGPVYAARRSDFIVLMVMGGLFCGPPGLGLERSESRPARMV